MLVVEAVLRLEPEVPSVPVVQGVAGTHLTLRRVALALQIPAAAVVVVGRARQSVTMAATAARAS